MQTDEYFRLCRNLEDMGDIFYAFFRMGYPVFTEKVIYAGVAFDCDGNFSHLLLNPVKWAGFNDRVKTFIIVHEALHVVLEHGVRGREKPYHKIQNIAMDIVIQEIARQLGFTREELPFGEEIVWFERYFDDSVPRDKNWEYYYELLMEKAKVVEIKYTPFDDHSGLQDQGKNDDIFSRIEDFAERNGLDIELPANSEEKESAGQLAGTTAGNHAYISTARKPRKRKWETVIRHWTIEAEKQRPKYNWVHQDRRLTFSLPADYLFAAEREEDIKNKIDIWFFQDTSGSCSEFRDRFFGAASSIPQDRFNIRMFCFDTKVYETSLKSGKLYGFGGTYFDILEKRCLEEKHYPKCVFVITDGYGNNIKCKYPARWHWFLSTDYTQCIDSRCVIHKLKDFE